MYRFFSFVCFIKIKKAAFGANVPDWCKNLPWWSRQQTDVCQGTALHLLLPRRSSKASKRRGAWTPEGDTEKDHQWIHTAALRPLPGWSLSNERTRLKPSVGSSRKERMEYTGGTQTMSDLGVKQMNPILGFVCRRSLHENKSNLYVSN